MPPKNKSKNAPNQHDKRHESGLAAPGKRVTKRQSNGQLNGAPNGKAVPAPPLPTTGLNTGFKFPRPAASTDPTAQAATGDHEVPPEGADRDRVCSDASQEDGGPCDNMEDAGVEAAPVLPSMGVQSSASRATVFPPGPGKLATIRTVLSYYPLRDAIAILILLLALPATLVQVIQMLFASLTFVPPNASMSLSNLPVMKEIFNSQNFGYPALATILFVDLMFWLLWAMTWTPIQNLFLDLSQAVIAVSLSGAAASTGGPTYSIATTTIIVCIVHVLRYRAIHLTALDYLRSVIHKVGIGVQLDTPPLATNFLSSSPIEYGSFQNACRTILGIHIISQGITTCIRRSLVKANEQNTSAPAITRTEPEATAGNESISRSSTGLAEAAQHAASALAPDLRPAGTVPPHSDANPREPSGKKKRKQANQVRSQQPLWAAIASTKVTFVKEMEQRLSAEDAREAAKMDTTASNTQNPNPNTNTTTNRIWTCEVRDTEIAFSVELSHAAAMETAEGIDSDKLSAGIDRSKPFFVRINGAAWSSTRITVPVCEGDAADQTARQFDGEIFGLAPLSSYNCEIVGISSQDVFCSARIITQPAPTAEQTASAAQPQHQSLRPSTPITMLKQSIAAAEGKLNDTRNRSRKTKKDVKAAQSDVRKEVNALKAKLESSGGDDKLERRIQQLRASKSQAEESIADSKRTLADLGDIPALEQSETEAVRQEWRVTLDAKTTAIKDFDGAKAEAEKEINALRADVSQAKNRREKAATRLQQRKEELERVTSKRQAEMSARGKHNADRAREVQNRESELASYQHQTAGMDNETHHLQQRLQENIAEIQTLQSPPPYPGYSSVTPDNMSSTNPLVASPSTTAFPPFGAMPFHQSYHTPQTSMSQPAAPPGRGRSSSMLSAYSGFTDGGEDTLLPPEHRPQPFPWHVQQQVMPGAHAIDDRKDSDGSGNSSSLNGGSTGSNSPRPEAKVFVPGGKAATPLSPIGPPSSKGKEKAVQSPLQSHVW